MVMKSTSAVEVRIHAVSPESMAWCSSWCATVATSWAGRIKPGPCLAGTEAEAEAAGAAESFSARAALAPVKREDPVRTAQRTAAPAYLRTDSSTFSKRVGAEGAPSLMEAEAETLIAARLTAGRAIEETPLEIEGRAEPLRTAVDDSAGRGIEHLEAAAGIAPRARVPARLKETFIPPTVGAVVMAAMASGRTSLGGALSEAGRQT
mmetsp:Transcript_72142/g.227648  ORF Transcript_72142/g.227648 Transcript_72142/m.227648 type:complete len:207 (+) Transcript_72142:1198-1818(+)